MSVLLETTEGEIVIDLLVEESPKECLNFLKLCKIKYYNYSPFYNLEKDFIVESGDPEYPKGSGGSSIWGLLRDSKDSDRLFVPKQNDMKHDKIGFVSFMVTKSVNGTLMSGSQFVINLSDSAAEDLKNHVIFGQIAEGFETLDKINNSITDEDKRFLKDIRILHTYILEDPFDDPEGLEVPSESPQPTTIQLSTVRLNDAEIAEEVEEDDEETKMKKEAEFQALSLELLGDIPHAAVRPPENVLFVCKLNPLTQDEDLKMIFGRFGTILSCEIIREKLTGKSLQYAFIEYDKREDCETAYSKMDDVLIDDRRIHVDFSQSVSKLSQNWRNQSNSLRKRKHGERFVEENESNRSKQGGERRDYGDESGDSTYKKRDVAYKRREDSGYNRSDRYDNHRRSERDGDYRRSERDGDYRKSDRESDYRKGGRESGQRRSDRESGQRRSDREGDSRRSDRDSDYRNERNGYRNHEREESRRSDRDYDDKHRRHYHRDDEKNYRSSDRRERDHYRPSSSSHSSSHGQRDERS